MENSLAQPNMVGTLFRMKIENPFLISSLPLARINHHKGLYAIELVLVNSSGQQLLAITDWFHLQPDGRTLNSTRMVKKGIQHSKNLSIIR